jgi:3-hydroxyisobutyrate dehydrogenase
MPASPVVGIAGTGRMGRAAALRLAGEGFAVTVANRTVARAAQVAAAAGCTQAESFASLGAACDVVAILTSGEDATRETVTGPRGVLAGIRPGAMVLVMSTVTPQVVHELAKAAKDVGAVLTDVPISGRPSELTSGDVTLLAGGSADMLAPARPVLDALGRWLIVGPTGGGAAMKLGVNAVVFGLVTSIAECLTLTTAAGVDASLAYSVLQASAVSSTFIDLRRQSFVDGPGPAVQFTMESSRETLELIVRAAEEAGAHLPQTLTNLNTVRQAVSSGLAEKDITQLAEFLTSRGSAGTHA